jgi:hypothetical protein
MMPLAKSATKLVPGSLHPGANVDEQLPSDHGLESGDDFSRLCEGGHTALDRGDDDRLGFGKPIGAASPWI